MINLIIVGTGAVAAEITSFIEEATYLWNNEIINIKGYLEFEEYRYLHEEYKYTAPILGDIDSYEILENDYFIIANANVKLRADFAFRLKNKGAKFINLIHPTAIVSRTAQIGIGNILSPYTQIGPNAKLGDFNILTSFSCASHDCKIGDYNSFSTCIVCGHASIGNRNSFYIRSTVVPKVTIGDDCIIQAGMVVDKNTPDNATVFYRFKEKTIAIPKE